MLSPELVTTGVNQTWSWDITKVLGPKKWSYFYLHVLLAIFSRTVVGWVVADRENSREPRIRRQGLCCGSAACGGLASPRMPIL